MIRLIKLTVYGLLLLMCWKCVESTLCTSRTNAPLHFNLKTADDGEMVDTTFDSLTVTGVMDDVMLDSNLIDAFNITNGNLFLAPLEDRITYDFQFDNSIHVDFNFYYQQQAEFLNDACGFIYEYTIDSLTYQQRTTSLTYTIPAETSIDTIYNDADTTQIERIDTTTTGGYDTTVHVGPIIDSVRILNPNIIIDDASENIDIYIHPVN